MDPTTEPTPLTPLTPLTLRPTEPADLDYWVAAENHPSANRWVTPRPKEYHRARLADPDLRYVVVERAGEPVGCGVLAGAESYHRAVEIRRIVMTERDRGLGTQTMRLLIDLAFDELSAHRLWLDVVEQNTRARHVYARLGFTEEGTLRDAFYNGGAHHNLVLMSMLPHERPR